MVLSSSVDGASRAIGGKEEGRDTQCADAAAEIGDSLKPMRTLLGEVSVDAEKEEEEATKQIHSKYCHHGYVATCRLILPRKRVPSCQLSSSVVIFSRQLQSSTSVPAFASISLTIPRFQIQTSNLVALSAQEVEAD